VAPLRPLDFDGVQFDFFARAVLGIAGDLGDFFDNVVAFNDFAEDGVFIVEPGRGGDGDEKLAAVGMGTGVGHGEEALFPVVEGGMEFVGEFVAGSAAAGTFGTAALDHKIRDHPVEDQVVEEGLAGLGAFGKGHEVFDGLGRFFGIEPGFKLSLGGIEEGVDFIRHESIVSCGDEDRHAKTRCSAREAARVFFGSQGIPDKVCDEKSGGPLAVYFQTQRELAPLYGQPLVGFLDRLSEGNR
jgi:hypothetical protein